MLSGIFNLVIIALFSLIIASSIFWNFRNLIQSRLYFAIYSLRTKMLVHNRMITKFKTIFLEKNNRIRFWRWDDDLAEHDRGEWKGMKSSLSIITLGNCYMWYLKQYRKGHNLLFQAELNALIKKIWFNAFSH